jgi:flagellar hook-associated protein 2
MSESAVKSYEEKAKTGQLFADRDLSNLYSRLTNAIQSVGSELEAAGISVTYDNGLTTLSLNESKLRSNLESDPDKVRDVFTRSRSSGASRDGLMQALKTPLDMYAKTTGGSKGILIERAGSVLSPTSLYQNTIQKQLDALEKEISSWQDKMSDKVDYYTSKFTQLEVLINEMNSQSSALAGLTGGY